MIEAGKRIIKRTIANLSSLSLPQAEAIRAVLKGQALAPAEGPFEIIRSRAHGAVKAITSAMSRLCLATLLDRKPSHARDLVLAMIAARVLEPQSKLAEPGDFPACLITCDADTIGRRNGAANKHFPIHSRYPLVVQ